MNRRISLLAAAVAITAVATAALPAGPAGAQTPQLVVGGYSADRVDEGYGLYTDCTATLREYLADPASFGPEGVADVELTVSEPGVDVATEANLAAYDIFFTGWVRTDSYTDEEKDALLQFVLDGGAMIATTDGTDHDMSDIFGMVLEDDGSEEGDEGVVTDPSHPVTDGPFGPVADYSLSGDYGWWSDLGPAHELGAVAAGPYEGEPDMAVIEPDALGEGSGPVFLVADVDLFTDFDCSDDDEIVLNEVLVKNIFAWVAGVEVEPTTTTTAPPTTTTAVTTTTARAAATATPRFTG